MKQNIKSLNPAFLCQCTLPKIPSIIITINKYIDTTAVVCYSVWDPTLRVFKLRYMKDIDGEKNRANYYLNTNYACCFFSIGNSLLQWPASFWCGYLLDPSWTWGIKITCSVIHCLQKWILFGFFSSYRK